MDSSRVLLLLFAIFLVLSPPIVAGEPPHSIPRTAVESSNLKSVGYDAASKTLEVEFNHGGIYRYLNVPPATHKALMKSESKGNFFNANIRRKFRFQRWKEAS